MIDQIAFVVGGDDFRGVDLKYKRGWADGDLLCEIEFEVAASNCRRVVLFENSSENAVEFAGGDAGTGRGVEFFGDVEDFVCSLAGQRTDGEDGNVIDEGEAFACGFDMICGGTVSFVRDGVPFVEQDGDCASAFNGE